MNDVLIIGFGLLGSSLAYSLKANGYHVFAYDKDESSLAFGKENNLIDGIAKLDSFESYSYIFLCVYPSSILEYVKKIASLKHNEGTCIFDVTGLKSSYLDEVLNIVHKNKMYYVSLHPMAGGEERGASNYKCNLFENKNLIYVYSDESLAKEREEARKVNSLLKGRYSELDKESHDKIIAYVSHLPHVLAMALMNKKDVVKYNKYIGQSFLFFIRIASFNSGLWTELLVENKDNLCEEIDEYVSILNSFKNELINEDKNEIESKLIQSTSNRKEIER